MISFDNITKVYSPNIVALKDVSFDISEKEFLTIAGRSGAGKSTLLKLLIGQEKPTDGQIFFDGKDLVQMKGEKLTHLRRRIGTVFQDYKLLPSKTIYENIAYVMEVMGSSGEQIAEDVPQVLDIVGLTEKAKRFPNQLSAGELQRAAIARAFIHRPDVILADEPTGNLDPYHTREVVKLLLKINELGKTVILATHNKEIINSLARRVITLEEGRVVRDEARGKFIL